MISRDVVRPLIAISGAFSVLFGIATITYAFYGEGGYYSQAYYQSSYQTTFSNSVTESLDLTVFGSISKGSGTFVIDHPLDPKNKLLYHSFVESPEAKNVYDGVATIGSNGEVKIALPAYFMVLNKDVRYQVNGIDAPQPELHVKKGVADNSFVIAGGVPGKRVSWQVTGVRQDAYILENPIVVEVEKGVDALVGPGEFLHDDVYPVGLRGLGTSLMRTLRDSITSLTE